MDKSSQRVRRDVGRVQHVSTDELDRIDGGKEASMGEWKHISTGTAAAIGRSSNVVVSEMSSPRCRTVRAAMADEPCDASRGSARVARRLQ